MHVPIFITTRKRSFGQGNVFTDVYLSCPIPLVGRQLSVRILLECILVLSQVQGCCQSFFLVYEGISGHAPEPA